MPLVRFRAIFFLPGHGLLVAALFAFLVAPSYATVDNKIVQGRFGVGVNYPGFGLRYFIADRYALDARAYFAKNILLAGPRLCRYLGEISGILPYIAIEVDFVSFKGEVSKGTGILSEALVGGEYYLGEKFSFQLDFGPSYVSLKDKNYSVSVSGIEFIINVGLNYYFGSKAKAGISVSPPDVYDGQEHFSRPSIRRTFLPVAKSLGVENNYQVTSSLYNSKTYNEARHREYAVLNVDSHQ